jgi:hypothetical protein
MNEFLLWPAPLSRELSLILGLSGRLDPAFGLTVALFGSPAAGELRARSADF